MFLKSGHGVVSLVTLLWRVGSHADYDMVVTMNHAPEALLDVLVGSRSSCQYFQ